MADDVNVNTEGTVKKLSHKLFKRLLQKEKRKLKRQKAAEARKQTELNEETQLENDKEYRNRIEAVEADIEKREALQREINEKLWLQREAEAQEEFACKKLEEERRIKQKEEQEKAIKLEWERQQEKEQEEKERKEKATKDKEEALFREIEKEVTPSQDRFHNPVAPANYGTEKDAVNCSFYLKTGACRFGERCSRQHPRPSSGVTLLIPAMYSDIRHIESALDIADRDTGLEFDEQDAYKNFLEFYDDVYPEFEKSGRVLQFKVCCNYEPHLRGNVYVQYSSEEHCQKAFADFNGRWYAGRQLSCEFSPVTNWKSAICGLFAQNRCPRGKNCNFLHVYRNPDDWSEQRTENRRYDRNSRHCEGRGRRHYLERSRQSSDRCRDRNDEQRVSDRDSYRSKRDQKKRRRKHQSRSRSHSDDDSYRKRKRRHRDRSLEGKNRKQQTLTSSITNGESVEEDASRNMPAKDKDNYNGKRSRSKSPLSGNSASSESDRSQRSQHRRKSKRKHRKRKWRSNDRENTVHNWGDAST